MRSFPRVVLALCLLLLVAGAVLCFTPLYGSYLERTAISLGKLLGLAVAAAAAWMSFGRHGRDDRQRRSWSLLAAGLTLYVVAQSVLAYHQIILQDEVPFPSLGDWFFVPAALLIIWALFDFCLIAFRSGMPLGGPLAFWGPALGVAVLFAVAAYPLLAPVLHSGGESAEVFLNLFYPVASFVTLAPCLVALRMAFKFRGGRLLTVWLPLTVGFSAVMVSDVFFSYMTSLEFGSFRPVVDFLYFAGYTSVAGANLNQIDLLNE